MSDGLKAIGASWTIELLGTQMSRLKSVLLISFLLSLMPPFAIAQVMSVSCDAVSQYLWDSMQEFEEYFPRQQEVKIKGDLSEGTVNVSGISSGVWDGQWVVVERIPSDFGSEELFVLKRLEPQRTLAEYKTMTLTSDYSLATATWTGFTGVIVISLHCNAGD